MTLKQMMAAQNGSAYGQYLSANSNRGFDWRMAAPVAGIAALPALAAIGGGSAAASGAATAGAPAVSSAGGAFSLGSLMKNPLTGLGVQGLFSLLGQRSQNKAMDKQLASQNASLAKQMELEIADRAEQKRQFDIQQAAAKAALDAQNTMSARQLSADEADRAYARQQSEYQRQLMEKREAYLDPYRQQSQAARYSLMRMLGIG